MIRFLTSSVLLQSFLATVHAVTIYGTHGASHTNGASSTASATGPASTEWVNSLNAYNNVTLQPPALPNPMPPTAFTIAVPNLAQNMQNLSIPQKGDFYGFSIDMTVAEQIIGKNASIIQVPFLNILAAVADRGGGVRVRVGGNAQETATLVPSLPNNTMIAKVQADITEPASTEHTHVLEYTDELLHLLSNVSSLVNAKWYLGIPFDDPTHPRLQIAERADAILGHNVLGYQVGNKPSLYASHQRRTLNYSVPDYFYEFGAMTNAIHGDQQIVSTGNLVAPSLQGFGKWSPEALWATGFLNAYGSAIGVISMEHYPDHNCAGPLGLAKNPQDVFPNYLNHTSSQRVVQPYLNTSIVAQQLGKEFMMFETNTASCGGFPGVSDSFGSAIWAVDYGLQMAYSNFTGALLHTSGHDSCFNPFTPPPTNLSRVDEWTVGPILYSTLFMAEVLGKSNTARVVDLSANGANEFTPAYAIYENDALARIALINFMNEQNGTGAYSVGISVGGGATGEANATPAQVKVKYLLAPSVSEKEQILWANQTFGGRFQVDGRLSGRESIETIPCDQTTNTCVVSVPAPGAALVFLSSGAQASVDPGATRTYSTSVVTTHSARTATADPTEVAHSNGHKAGGFPLSGTSKGGSSANAARGRYAVSFSLTALAVLFGALVLSE